jgi:hypothetical protein
MQLVSSLSSKLLLAAVPAVAASAIAAPSQASSFAGSGALVNLDEFSLAPETTDTVTDTQTLAVLGQVITTANADAQFRSAPPAQATNRTLSTAQGSGNLYQGQASSFAGVSGLFKVNKSETFSFNFLALLGLNASVDNPQSEQARASGKILFNLFDNRTNRLLDSFSLLSQLSSDQPFNLVNSLTASSHWNFNQSVDQNGSSGDFISSITGQYSRQFDSDEEIRLEGFQENVAEVRAVPEPGLGVGLVSLFAFLWVRKRSNAHKEATLSASSPSQSE